MSCTDHGSLCSVTLVPWTSFLNWTGTKAKVPGIWDFFASLRSAEIKATISSLAIYSHSPKAAILVFSFGLVKTPRTLPKTQNMGCPSDRHLPPSSLVRLPVSVSETSDTSNFGAASSIRTVSGSCNLREPELCAFQALYFRESSRNWEVKLLWKKTHSVRVLKDRTQCMHITNEM